MKPASVVLALLLSTMLAGVSAAQSNGVPASVTSFGFGGSRNTAPGVPASVTSVGPRGFGPNASQCCATQFFPPVPTHVGPFSNFNHHGNGNGHGHNNGNNNNNYGIYPGYAPIYSYGGYYGGYAPAIVAQQEEVGGGSTDEDTEADGPTVFEHRGNRRPPTEEAYSRGYEEGRAAAEETRHDHRRPDADRKEDRDAKNEDKSEAKEEAAPAIVPKTVLVYKDNHKEEIANYAIVGDQLFDFTNGKRKIAISDLDLSATTKANDARGVDFQLPAVRAKK
jgi:hypothetical protein